MFLEDFLTSRFFPTHTGR